MAVINEHGLFQGKRLRRCSAKARYLWPYLYVASNGFARIELDFDFIADRFASFRADAPTSEELSRYFLEFKASRLIFAYVYNGAEWAQWDTKRSDTKDYKTAIDKASPAPPEPEYVRWLKELHGADWMDYHWNKDAAYSSEETFTQNSAECSPNLGEVFGLGSGSGSVIGEVKGEGKTKSICSSKDARTGECVQLLLKGGSSHLVTPERVAELTGSHPHIDVTAELHRMAEWLIARPKRRKTEAGIERFIISWLGRSTTTPKKAKAADLRTMDYSSLERVAGGVQ